MKIRLDVEVPGVAKRHAVVEVPDQIGYAVLRRGEATQLPAYRPATAQLAPEQIDQLARP